MKKHSIFYLVALVLFIVSLFVNYLGGVGGLFIPNTIAEISNQYQTSLTPVALTFSIWGLIYFLATLSLSSWAHTIFIKKQNPLIIIEGVQYFSLITLFNTLWIISWVYERLILAQIAITFMLILLMKISNKFHDSKLYISKIFFQIYYAWISIAFWLNVLVILCRDIEWCTSMPMFIISLSIATLLVITSLIDLFRKGSVYFTLVIFWALLGIFLNDKFDPLYPYFENVLSVLLFIMISGIAVFISKKIRVMR